MKKVKLLIYSTYLLIMSNRNSEIIKQPLVSLPPKIEAYEVKLRRAKNDITSFLKLSEGLIFNYVGVDALVGAIPVVGDLYTAMGGMWLISQAGRVRAGFQEKLVIAGFTLIDVALGLVPGPGDIVDIFVRVHAWNGQRLISHTDEHLRLINQARQQLAMGINPDLTALEDILFRSGKTKGEEALKYATIAVVIGLAFVGCAIMSS